jgi:hypothetical protein
MIKQESVVPSLMPKQQNGGLVSLPHEHVVPHANIDEGEIYILIIFLHYMSKCRIDDSQFFCK